MTLDDAVASLSSTGEDFLGAAMEWALGHWDQAGPRFAAVLDAYARGEDRSEATACAVFYIVHLQAEAADTSGFGSLCRLLHDAEVSSLVLGDAITETLHNILISTYDGALPELTAVIEDAEADDWVRDAAMTAMAHLTRTGRVPEAVMRADLLRWLDELQPQAESMVWVSWTTTVAFLGCSDMAGQAERLFERGFVNQYAMNSANFQDMLQRTLDDPGRMDCFGVEDIGPVHDMIDELENWGVVRGHFQLVQSNWCRWCCPAAKPRTRWGASPPGSRRRRRPPIEETWHDL